MRFWKSRRPAGATPRLLLILPGFTAGGAEKQAFSLAAALRHGGLEVTLWALPLRMPKNQDQLALMKRLDIPCHELKAWPNWTRPERHHHPLLMHWRIHRQWNVPLKSFLRQLPDTKADIIVPFTAIPCQIACLVKRRVGAWRVLWNHRGGDDDAGIRYDNFLIGKMMTADPDFVTNNQGGARFLQRTFGLADDEVTVIPNAFVMRQEPATSVDAAEELELLPAVDAAGATNDSSTGLPQRASPSPLETTPRLLHVANHFSEKDPWTLLRAMALLRQDHVPFHLDLVGGFPSPGLREELASMICDLGLAANVSILGGLPQDAVAQLLRSSQIGLLSSRTEGMPNAVMEYMQHALPVVASDLPGTRDLVGPSQWHFLFKPGDAIQCAERVRALLADAPARVEIGRQNRERLTIQFNSDRIFDQWRSFLLQTHRTAPRRNHAAQTSPAKGRRGRLKIGWLLVGDENTGSSRIHGIQLHRWLRLQGHQSEILQSSAGYEEALIMTGAEQTAVVQAEFDLLVFQRVHRGSIGSFLRRLKAVGTKTVFFAADRFACDIISEFDAILTASESLRTYWIDQGREADRVFAVPDAIETSPAVIKRVDAHQSNSNLKLGWLGAEGHWHTVTRLKELLDHTPELSDLELVTISNHPHASLPWTRERVWNDLLGCDIAVVPADVSNPASLVKSNNRVSSLQAIGLPVICARIPSYEPSIVHGDTGFFADTDAEWIHALTALRDPNVRKTIALRGHARAWSLYHPNLIGPRFEAVVHTILD